MTITWQQTQNPKGGISYLAQSNDTEEKALQAFTDACVDKAVTLLTEAMPDSARYLVFNWSVEKQTLSISLNDDHKTAVTPNTLHIEMPAFNAHFDEEDLLFWLKDYLGVCTRFLNYSLLAVYTTDNERYQLI